MNAVERKFINSYYDYKKKTHNEKCLFQALIRDTEDENKISVVTCSIGLVYDTDTDSYGVDDHIEEKIFYHFEDVNDALGAVSHLDFLPKDYRNRNAYFAEVEKYTEPIEDEVYYFGSNTFFSILDAFDFEEIETEEPTEGEPAVEGTPRDKSGHRIFPAEIINIRPDLTDGFGGNKEIDWEERRFELVKSILAGHPQYDDEELHDEFVANAISLADKAIAALKK